MHAAQAEVWPEPQIVHRLFSIRWTRGCMYTRIHGAEDDAMTRWQIDTWSRVMNEVIPQLGGDFVSIIDTRAIKAVPKGLWLALMEVGANMVRKPTRRALLAAEGWAGDEQAEASQLILAGQVRVFRDEQFTSMVTWLADAGTIDAARLQTFLT